MAAAAERIKGLTRTAKAVALANVGAEYRLGWLPRGTHDWRKFPKPSPVARPAQAARPELQRSRASQPAGGRGLSATST
jgi:2-polyprenyl-3-methyl-5-hydroxy-6-metoxy-1,4-benzoquinol methylase